MVARKNSSRLLSFNISRPNITDRANGLYANGNHQCEVIIDIVKQIRAADNTWASAELTEEERDSLTLVEWSERDHDKLPSGWSCDTERNRYDLGLWSRAPVNDGAPEVITDYAGNLQAERISRYLRCDLGAAGGGVQFMARVVIEGKTYTTHCSKGDFAFESSIVINPESPIYLDVGELEHHEDLTAFSHFVLPNIFMGWVHYWTPPLGFKFVENKGFDKPLVLPGDGNAFDSTLSRLVENVAPGFFYKAGTLTNKNEIGQTLEIGEIHSGPGLPDPHAPVRFNERPTIMRAVQLVSNNFSFSEHHGRKAWRLMDNFGTEQAFALEGDRKGNLCLLGRSEIGFRYPTVFKITLPGGKVSTNELYSNGRHQCQVEVEVELMQLQLVGNPVRVPLNSKERDSLTITVFSTNADEPLPRGWSCDKEKNIFDIGIRRSATEVDDAVHVAEAEMVSRRRLDAVDVVERYMRVDPNASSKSVRFMAIIEVDGVRYTTNYVGDEFTFLSYVDIDFIRPYKLLERELVLHYDAEALWDGVFDIDVYYWTPPSGLRFLFNRGLDSPVSLSWEGKISESFYAISAGTYTNKGGVVCGKDVANPTLLLSDIYTGHPEGDSKVIRFNERSTIMRLVRFRQIGNKDVRLDNRSRWRLWDNYGCEQVYIVEQADGGLHIVLEDG